jgi:Leucine-rich repeat (LRR) protein
VIPAEFFLAENVKKYLVELNINSNPLLEIPITIGNLQCLKVLGISYTEVEEIPKSLVQINGLEQIYCFGTTLKKP